MKTVTPQIQAQLDNQYGTEPILLLEVEWVPGTPILYSDRKINDKDYPYPVILSMGSFDTTMALSKSSASTEFTVELDDTSGVLKTIINENNVHKADVRIYLTYPGTYLDDKLFLLAGELVTPFNWSEKDRAISFTVLTKLDSNPVGFAMEEGDFPNIPEEALGKAWPLVFGQVCHIPAVQVRAPRVGTLKSGTGIHDFTLEPRLCQARRLSCKAIEGNELQDCIDENIRNSGGRTGREACRTAERDRKIQSIENNIAAIEAAATNGGKPPQQEPTAEQECIVRRREEICRLKQTLADQLAYETPTLDIRGGDNFPQGEVVVLYMEGALYKGTFSGETFTVSDRAHPSYYSYAHPDCSTVPMRGFLAYSLSEADAVLESMGTYGTYFRFIDDPKYHDTECSSYFVALSPGGGPEAAWRTYGLMTSEDFFWAPAGTEVRLVGESEYLHIVSLLPGTVDKISAYKTYADGRQLLTELPPEIYTVYKTDYGHHTVTEIGFTKDLPLFNDWYDSQLYVSFTSDIGPNVADIIEWLAGEYTDLAVDADSFAYVKSLTTKYPCNFFLLERPDVYKLMKDLAYQSRCAIFIRNKTIYLVCLAIEPTSVKNITEGDIIAGSFKETMTPTSSLKTTHKITWSSGGTRVNSEWDTNRDFILKYDINKFGVLKKNIKYYTQNSYDTILKSATFWLIRESNSWREIEFELPIKFIDLDIGDAITVNVSAFSPDPVLCIIVYAKFEADKNTQIIKCWTPIRSGESEPYYWAWPSQQSITATWPLPNDPDKSAGYKDMSPPTGHLLLGGSTNEDQIIVTTGDYHPSDLDDVTPVIDCQVSDEMDIEEMPWQERILKTAASNSSAAMAPTQQDNYAEDKCGFPSNGRCGYLVKIHYRHMVKCITRAGPNSISALDVPIAPCQDCQTITEENWTMCHTFGSPASAKRFWYKKQAEAHLQACPDGIGLDAGDTKVLEGNIHSEISEGRMITPMGFVCEPLWPGTGMAAYFQCDCEFGEAIKQDYTLITTG